MPSFRVLGVRVDAVDLPKVCATMERWIDGEDRCQFIAVTGMHGITEAQHDPESKAVLGAADLVVPDGVPLVDRPRPRACVEAPRVRTGIDVELL